MTAHGGPRSQARAFADLCSRPAPAQTGTRLPQPVSYAAVTCVGCRGEGGERFRRSDGQLGGDGLGKSLKKERGGASCELSPVWEHGAGASLSPTPGQRAERGRRPKALFPLSEDLAGLLALVQGQPST